MLNISITSLPMQANRLPSPGNLSLVSRAEISLCQINHRMHEKIEGNSQKKGEWFFPHNL
jgi:hypothetical protein